MRVVFISVVYVMCIFVDIIIWIVGWFKDLVFRKFYKKFVSFDV